VYFKFKTFFSKTCRIQKSKSISFVDIARVGVLVLRNFPVGNARNRVVSGQRSKWNVMLFELRQLLLCELMGFVHTVDLDAVC
jgi:hypothetical protein